MRSTCIRMCLILTVFAFSSVVVAQTPAKEPNAVPAKRVVPRVVQPQAPAPTEPQPPALRVGMPAPAFKVAKWFKGTPVEKLEEGNLYVVEFWATWCGPCRATIPHLTELAHKHAGKITFIGVSVWERPKDSNDAIFAVVEPFVKEMGEKMEYNVAADGVDRTMATTWMTAADRGGIPCAFVIGRDGKIAWIGHPAAIDNVLDEVLAGTWDVQAEAQRQEAEWRDKQERLKLEAPIREAMKTRDNKAILDAIDKALAVKPEMEDELMPMRFNTLVQVDEAAGFAYLRTLLEKGDFEKNPNHAFNAATIVSRYAATLKNPDYAVVIAAMEKAKAAEHENPNALTLYADVLSKAGKIDAAIEMQQKAIEKAGALDGERWQTWLESQKTRLEEYKAKKTQGANP